MDWNQQTKTYAVFLTNELLDHDPSEEKGIGRTRDYYRNLADDPDLPAQVREAADRAADAHDALLAAIHHAQYSLEEFEETAFHSPPPLERDVRRRPKRFFPAAPAT